MLQKSIIPGSFLARIIISTKRGSYKIAIQIAAWKHRHRHRFIAIIVNCQRWTICASLARFSVLRCDNLSRENHAATILSLLFVHADSFYGSAGHFVIIVGRVSIKNGCLNGRVHFGTFLYSASSLPCNSDIFAKPVSRLSASARRIVRAKHPYNRCIIVAPFRLFDCNRLGGITTQLPSR